MRIAREPAGLTCSSRERCCSTFTVNTTADENDANKVPGDLSLREAIIQSNATPGPNTIIVPAGTYTLTIPGSGETGGQTGDLDVTNSVTIQGAGSGSTIVNGNQLDRVLYVLGSGSTVPTVSISGVTIQGGRAGLLQLRSRQRRRHRGLQRLADARPVRRPE